MQGWDVGLKGAVALHGNKAPPGAQTLALGVNEADVPGVDLRYYHGHVLGPAVGAVVGDHRTLQLRVLLLQSADILFLHIHGAEDKIYLPGQLLRVRLCVQHGKTLGLLGNGDGHGPAARHSLLVGPASAAGAGGQGSKLEPGMTLHQGDKALTHHSGAADDANAVLFHSEYLLKLKRRRTKTLENSVEK